MISDYGPIMAHCVHIPRIWLCKSLVTARKSYKPHSSVHISYTSSSLTRYSFIMCWDSAPRYICRHEYSHPNPHSPTWQCSNHAECDGSGATCPVYKKSVRTNAPDKDQTSNIICSECRSAASSREGMRRICINIVESEIIEERNDF